MRGNQRSFSGNQSGRRSGDNRGGRSGQFRGGYGNRPRFNRGGGGMRQATFDPSDFVASLKQVAYSPEKPQVEAYVPTNSFADFALVDELKASVAARGYTQPTPIQDQAIPLILNGQDVVGIANTGTGKTAAFLLPLINKVVTDPEARVLIVVPTRELALQVQDELLSFRQGMQYYSALCIGGASMQRQIESLRRRPAFIIGTPGRLKDLIMRGKLNLQYFSSIVLDEVDRMLDMGFVHDVQQLIAELAPERHSLFFSATMNERVRGIMQSFLRNPVTITIKSHQTPSKVVQKIIKVNGKPKIEILHELLLEEGFDKVVVFGRTKHGANAIAEKLYDRGLRVAAIHGNKSQAQRQRALRDFRENRIQALIATDVISRGLDIDDVTHVINFDLPPSYEDYIHRIGRTGRASKEGTAVTFVE